MSKKSQKDREKNFKQDKEERLLKIFSENEKKNVLQKLNERFGIKEIPGILVKSGNDRLFLFTGSLNKEEIREIEKTVFIERLGAYIGKIFTDKNNEEVIRLSIEGSQILGKKAEKNIVEINKEQTEEWMKGHELEINFKELKSSQEEKHQDKEKYALEKGFVIMKYQDNFLGTGKLSEEKISNFIPKNRRLKEKD